MSSKKAGTPRDVPGSTATPRPGAGARTAPREPDPIIFSIRGSQAWRDWLRQFASHRRVNATALIDQVLAEAARREGFAAPPSRRSQDSPDHNGRAHGS